MTSMCPWGCCFFLSKRLENAREQSGVGTEQRWEQVLVWDSEALGQLASSLAEAAPQVTLGSIGLLVRIRLLERIYVSWVWWYTFLWFLTHLSIYALVIHEQQEKLLGICLFPLPVFACGLTEGSPCFWSSLIRTQTWWGTKLPAP